MNYQQYPTYKPTNIEWIWEIPKDWDVRKISHSFDLIWSGTTPKSDDESLYIDWDINWLITGDLNDWIINETSKKITLKGFRKYSTLKKYPIWSLVIAMYGATIGKLWFMNIEACTNQACCVLWKSKVFDMKYVFYWFLSSKKHIIFLSYWWGQPNISKDTISTLKIITPPLQTQQKISNYLDTQTTQINTLISKDEKLIELLKQKRVSLINEVVTKGLDKNVEMKDSGVEWIGKIPKDWEVRKLKYSTQISSWEFLSNKFYDENWLYSVMWWNWENTKTNKYNLNWDFLIIWRVGAYCGNIHKINWKNWVTDNALIIQKIYNYEIIFLKEVLTIRNLNSLSVSNAQPLITGTQIKEELLPLPPLSQQKEIVEFLDIQTQKIDTIISKIEKRIELYKERKQSLIHHVVTWKIMV